jgi:hypothetical protein
VGKRLEVVEAVTSLLKRLHIRPPSQIQFRTIANTPATSKFSKQELLNALYALEFEGTIAIHHDHSFSVLKPATAM